MNRLSIGQSNPLAALDVTGSVRITSNFIAGSTDTSNAPGYTWSNDLTTGMYRVTNGQIGFSCGTSNVMMLTSSNVTTMRPASFCNNIYVLNASTSVTYPPPGTSVTSCNFTVTGQAYGNGAYTIAASSRIDTANLEQYAFDTDIAGALWMSAARYTSGTGNYSGSTTTTIGSSNYAGEYIELALPTSISLSNVRLISSPGASWNSNYAARDFYVAGSSNSGSTWELLMSVVNFTSWNYSATSSNDASKFSIPNTTSTYNLFRIIINKTVLWNYVKFRYIAFDSGVLGTANVGINTTTPSELVDIVGNAKITNAYITNAIGMGTSNTSERFDLQGGNAKFGCNVFMMSNVGIGFSNPTMPLDVIGTIRTTTNIMAGAADTSNAPGFTWSNDSNTGMYRPTARQIGFSIGGSNVMTLSNNLATFVCNTSISSNLIVTGTTTFSNNVSLLSNLTVMGQMTACILSFMPMR
jgi:hypothetical protein